MLMYQIKQKYFDHGLLEHAKEDYFIIDLPFCKSSLIEFYHLYLQSAFHYLIVRLVFFFITNI